MRYVTCPKCDTKHSERRIDPPRGLVRDRVYTFGCPTCNTVLTIQKVRRFGLFNTVYVLPKV